MCEHENSKYIETKPKYYLKKCLDCNEIFKVEKKQGVKKSIFRKILRR